MHQEMDIEKMALIAKSLGSGLRFKLYKILIENKDREIPVFELSTQVSVKFNKKIPQINIRRDI